MRLLVIIGVIALVASTGCIGVEEFEANKPTVDEATLTDTSYEKTGNETFRIEESREILGEQRGATIISHTAVYEKSANDLELNLTEEELESQLQNIDTEELIESQSDDIVDLIGEDNLVSIIADGDDRFTEDQIESALNLTGQSVSEFIEDNNVNVTEYVDRQDVIESIDDDQLETIVQQSSYNRTGSIYVVISTPSAGVLGTELNPLVLASSEDLLTQVEDRTNRNIEFGELERTETVNNTRGQRIEVEQYPATLRTEEGVDVDSKVLLARNPSYNGSVVVSVGAYPEFAEERSDLIEMIRKTDVKNN